MDIDIKKIITKQFFNTLSPDVCHHLMALAKERIDETEGEYVKAISSRKWNDNKAKLGCLLVSQLMEGNDVGCDVFTTTKTELLFTDMPLTEVLKGGEAIVEYADDYGDFTQRRTLPCRENSEFVVAFRDNSMISKLLSSRLNGCYIHPNVKLSDMGYGVDHDGI